MDTNGMSPDTVQQMLALLSQQQPQPTGQDTSLGIGSDPFGMNGGMPNGLSSAPMATNSVPSQGAAPPQFGTNLGGAGDMPLAPAGGTFGADPATQYWAWWGNDGNTNEYANGTRLRPDALLG